ncbi:MAG: acyl-CoA thioesterase [Clostridia bacterium]|nr:acyl-CoA thioesterase [Clostridia bacterium]
MENKIYDYARKVNYYETDKMCITHHSNYIRWMEEARTAYLNRYGCGYRKFEEYGVVSPVLSVSCQYKQTTTFEDEVVIRVRIKRYTGVKLEFGYEMTNAKTGALVFTGESEHCFLDARHMPVIVRKRFPELDLILKGLVSDE